MVQALLIAFAVLVPLASAALVVLAPPSLWVDTLFDDAYYYLGVARHLALGQGSMFAPPLATNGYQPLWLALLSGVALLVGADRTWLAAGMHLTILFCVLAFLHLCGRREGARWPAALTALCFPNVLLNGMETVLIPPLTLLYFNASGWKRGGISSLIFLARLDALGLIAGREFYQLAVHRKFDLRATAVLLAVILTYAAFNLFVFGIPVPISGLAKSVGNIRGENWPVGIALLASALPVLCGLVILWLGSGKTPFRNPEAIFAALFALACSTVYYGVLSGWTVWDWYRWPIMLLFYFTIVELIHAAPGTYRSFVIAILAAAMVRVPFNYFRHFHLFPVEAITWGQANVRMAETANPLAAITFAMGDRAGSFGYFMNDRARLIQTEGLVANATYLAALKTGRAEQFLADAGVDYLVVDRGKYWLDGAVYAIPEPVQGLSAHSGVMLLCFPETAEVPTFGGMRPERKVFRYALRIPCPPRAAGLFRERQSHYGVVRRESVWSSRPPGPFGDLR